MTKPAIVTVDDDPGVLSAIDSDLRARFADKYRVLKAESGSVALDTLKRLRERNNPVALLLSDQRMPKMGGVEFLHEAASIYPDAKRALLTAYADTDAAIRAINQVKLHYYLLKPWDPPEQHLYPVIEDLLADWQAWYSPPFEGVRVLSSRWSPQSYEIRDFLARHQVPYRWLDVEAGDHDLEVKSVMATLTTCDFRSSIVLFPDGSSLEHPTTSALADRLGLHTRADTTFYDLVIVGGGPAGLAAAVYGASEGLRTVLVEREAPGGQAALSSRIENYLGFPSGLSGSDLARRAVTQARRFGVEILAPQEAVGLRVDGPYRFVRLSGGGEISCHALLIATGVRWRKLDVPGADGLLGAGIYYNASAAEAASCKNEDVYIVGGANSAGQAALHFSRYARLVVMLVRATSLAASMSQYLIDQIQQTPNIRVAFDTTVEAVHGEERLQAITLRNHQTNTTCKAPAASLFVFIGAVPHTDWLAGLVERDERGFILSGPDVGQTRNQSTTSLPTPAVGRREPLMLETSVPGVFAVGDVRHNSVKRVASSVGEGSIAVQLIHRYLSRV